MAILTYAGLTMAELAKRMHDGTMQPIAERLSQENAVLRDAIFIEANGKNYHRTTVRTSLPSGTWRQVNGGVAPEASTTKQVDEPIGMLESFSMVDEAIVEGSGNPIQARLSEDVAFLEGLSQTLATTVFYGNKATTPESFNGIGTRLSSLSSVNCLGSSGTGSDLSSIYIVQWDMNGVFMVYPPGHESAGIEMEDDGKVTETDSSGYKHKAYQTHWKFKGGLVVKDNRSIQRVANIETTGTSNTFDDDVLLKAVRKLPREGRGAVIYANATILSQMDIKLKDKSNTHYTQAEEFGRPVTQFRGLPVRQCDAIVDTETALT